MSFLYDLTRVYHFFNICQKIFSTFLTKVLIYVFFKHRKTGNSSCYSGFKCTYAGTRLWSVCIPFLVTLFRTLFAALVKIALGWYLRKCSIEVNLLTSSRSITSKIAPVTTCSLQVWHFKTLSYIRLIITLVSTFSFFAFLRKRDIKSSFSSVVKPTFLAIMSNWAFTFGFFFKFLLLYVYDHNIFVTPITKGSRWIYWIKDISQANFLFFKNNLC